MLYGVHTGPGAFYQLMPHNAMAALFGAAFLYAIVALVMGVCAFWRGREQALYGVAMQDEDGDGSPPPDDCNDNDATVHPGATETADDGVDSDCDGLDDPADSGGA